MKRTRETSDLESGSAQWVQHNIHELKDLPEPQQTWKFRDVGISLSALLTLLDKDLIRRLDRKVGERSPSYRTKPQLYEAIQIFAECAKESDALLPCGHNAFLNQNGRLECKRCGASHTKGEVSV